MSNPREELKAKARELYISGQYATVSEIARALGIRRVDTVRHWVKSEGWDRQREKVVDATIALASLDSEPRALTELKVFIEQSVEQALVRHVGHAVEVQEKALQALRGLPVRTLTDAMAMLEYGVGLERVSRNLAPPGSIKSGVGSEGGLTADAILSAYVKIANSKVAVLVPGNGKVEDATTAGPEDGAVSAEAETVVN